MIKSVKQKKRFAIQNKTKKQRVFKKQDFYSGDGFVTSALS